MAVDHDEMRAIIVDAARDVFARYGYKKTTLDDIASSIYKAKSSLYYYFGSKEEVFQAVVESEIEHARKTIRKAVNEATTPEEKLRSYFMTGFAIGKELLNYWSFIKNEWMEVFSFTQMLKGEVEKEEIGNIAAILKEGADCGVFTVTNYETAAAAIRMAFEGQYRPWEGIDDWSLREENTITLMDIIIKGLKV